MRLQILNSFKGDDVRDIDTSTDEGRGTAAKMVADLLKTGSALFLEKMVNGKTYTYRVTGYDAERDKIKLTLERNEEVPEGGEERHTPRSRGAYRKRSKDVLVDSASGQVVSVAPVSGGNQSAVEDNPFKDMTWESVRFAINQLCEARGWHHGCPMPSATDQEHALIVAKGAPLHNGRGRVSFARERIHIDTEETCNECDYPQDLYRYEGKQITTSFYRYKGKIEKLEEPMAHWRLKMLMDTLMVRAGSVDPNAELVAISTLRTKITEGQWSSYILSGAFPEKSMRSGVTYILRKGLPTLAVTEKPLPDGKTQRKFLTALCLHPMAYYEETFAGSQPPTDEIIGHLMMIRADEHRFWKKSGQHPLEDIRAGV